MKQSFIPGRGLQLVPRWQRNTTVVVLVAFSLGFIVIGTKSGQFRDSIVLANRSVQRPLSQLILYCPIIGLETLILTKQLQSVPYLIRVSSRKVLARYLIWLLSILTIFEVVMVLFFWLIAAATGPGLDFNVTSIAATLNLLANIVTVTFSYTVLALLISIGVKSSAIGLFCVLGWVALSYILPITQMNEFLTPQLSADTMWILNMMKQILVLVISKEVLRIAIAKIDLPIGV